MKKLSGGTIILLLFLISSCTTKGDLSTIREISYSSDISGIISAKCGSRGCHGHDGSEFSLISYDDLIGNGGITAGDAHSSSLYRTITGRTFENKMPPSGSPALNENEITLIYVWIEQGAKNN